jgi:hypothetical protein
MIHNAVLDKCDALDGVKDGVIEDHEVRLRPVDANVQRSGSRDCLTKDQAETASAMTRPIRDPKSGSVLHPGRYYPGSELGWRGVGGPSPSGESHEGMRKIVFSPDWDYHTIKVPDDVERAVKADKGLLYGGDPDVSRFFKRGGKLLMYHGWADPLVSPDTSLMMFERSTRRSDRRRRIRSRCSWCRAWGTARAVPVPTSSTKSPRSIGGSKPGRSHSRSKPRISPPASSIAGVRCVPIRPRRTTRAPAARTTRAISGVSRSAGLGA